MVTDDERRGSGRGARAARAARGAVPRPTRGHLGSHVLHRRPRHPRQDLRRRASHGRPHGEGAGGAGQRLVAARVVERMVMREREMREWVVMPDAASDAEWVALLEDAYAYLDTDHAVVAAAPRESRSGRTDQGLEAPNQGPGVTGVAGSGGCGRTAEISLRLGAGLLDLREDPPRVTIAKCPRAEWTHDSSSSSRVQGFR